MLKYKLRRGDILKKILAIIVISFALIGGVFVCLVINKQQQDEYVTVTFDIDGQITEQEVLKGSSAVVPEVPEKVGYTFKGWDNEASLEIINKDQYYKAIYELNEYTISFNANCDLEIKPLTYQYNQKILEFEKPIREGYEFIGWFYQGVIFDQETMPAYDIELSAMWCSTITFEFDGDLEFEPIVGMSGKYIKAPTIKDEDKKEGYIVVWYKDRLYQEMYTFNRMPEESITLYGRFEKIKVVDPGFLDNLVNNELSNKIESYQQLVDYLEYLVYHRIEETCQIIIDYDVDSIQTAINRAFEDIKIDTYFRSSMKKIDNVVSITLSFEEEATLKASLSDLYIQLDNYETPTESTRSSDYDDFPINKIDKTYKVSTSEQLYYVIERGYRPTFDNNSDVVIIYEEAKNVLRNIIDDKMTDYEKVHAIYDWLILNVTYDKRLRDYVVENVPNTEKYRGFYLEGVFLDQRAVCDGISKAFVLLCRIEGIEAIRVVGVAINESFNHAWNKVCINNIWYVVDATSGGTIVEDNEVVNHSYLFASEDFFGSMYVATTYTDIVAYGEYNIYEEMYFRYDGYVYDFNITSLSELGIIIKWYSENFDGKTTIDMHIDYKYEGTLADELKKAMSGTQLDYIIPITTENNVLIIKEFELIKKG